MNIFLEQFASKMKGRKVVIVMDGATWHKSRGLRNYQNINIIIQPPYSPELNPVEKLWQYIKDKTIKNKFFIDLDELERCISNFVISISTNIIQTVCNVRYI